MRVLFLGYADSPLVRFLNQTEDVIITDGKINHSFVTDNKVEFIVSYGYRYLIKKEILNLVPVINLHISYLPYNKGADPNFWSFVHNTPKGATIHYVDENYDTGDIIVQEEIGFSDSETLRTSYNKLQILVQQLFKDNWNSIRNGTCDRIKQKGKGSLQRVKDKDIYIKDIASDYLDIDIPTLLKSMDIPLYFSDIIRIYPYNRKKIQK